MTEKLPQEERPENEAELARILREKGPEDPEARRLLNEWLEARELWANEQNTSRANIEVNLQRATLYRTAGYPDAAWEILEEVRLQARQEGEEELYAQAMEMMDEMDRERS